MDISCSRVGVNLYNVDFFFGLLLRSYIFYHLLINHALLLLCFLDVKAIPMEVAVTIKLRLETIVQVIKKQRVSHVNTLKKITLIVYKEILLWKIYLNISSLKIMYFIDCPIGYFGKNCSEKCSPPGYGELCSQTCDCVSCHHIFGCNETEVTTGKNIEIKILIYYILCCFILFKCKQNQTKFHLIRCVHFVWFNN